jgi:hypothetical protein
MRKLAVAAAAILVVLAVAALALTVLAGPLMVRWLDSVLSQPGVATGSHGTVRYWLWRGHLEIDDLAVKTELPLPRSYRAAHLGADGIGPRFLIDLALGKTVFRVAALSGRQLSVDDEALHARCAAIDIADAAYDAGSAQDDLPLVFFRRLHLHEAAATGLLAGSGVAFDDALLTMDGALGAPTAMSARVDALLVAPWASLLGGPQPARLDFDGQATLDAGDRRLTLVQHLLWRGGGTLALSLRLGGVPTSFAGRNWPVVAAGFATAWLEGLELSYEDASALERVLQLVAKARGKPVETLRAELIAALEARRPSLAEKPVLQASLSAVERFLREGGSLTLTLAPPMHLPFAGLVLIGRGDPARLAEALGLQIR